MGIINRISNRIINRIISPIVGKEDILLLPVTDSLILHLAGFYANLARDQIVTLDASDNVSSWKGLNNTNINADRLTGSLQPTYIANAINNLPALVFDGINDSLEAPLNIDYLVIPNITIFVTYISNSDGGNQALYGQDNLGFDRFVLVEHGSLDHGISTGDAGNPMNFKVVSELGNRDVGQILTVELQNGVGDGSQVYINGTSVATFRESHTNSGDSFLTIGNVGTAGTVFADVNIGEFIIYDRILSTSERQQVENYLSQKWKISLT